MNGRTPRWRNRSVKLAVGVTALFLLGVLASVAVADSSNPLDAAVSMLTGGTTGTDTNAATTTDTSATTTDGSSAPTGSTATDTTAATTAATTTDATTTTDAAATPPPAAPLSPATLVTDKASYLPGDAVTVTGANWVAGESIHFHAADTGSNGFAYDTDVLAASDGSVSASFALPTSFAGDFAVAATGGIEGTVSTSFSDAFAAVAGPPAIISDQADYGPGSIVTLTGTGWQPGESVHLFVNDDVGNSWSYSTDVSADSTGALTNQFQLPTFVVAAYSVTATGAGGETASASFTDAPATQVTAVSYVPATTTAGASGNWTIGFTTSASGALAATDTITIGFNGAFTPAASPTVSLGSGFNAHCNASATSSGSTITVTLGNQGGPPCALPALTAATLTVGLVTNPGPGSYAANTFNLSTFADTRSASPSSPVVISSHVSGVTFAGSSQVEGQTATWTEGFTTSAFGALTHGDTVTVTFNSAFVVPATPTVALTGGFAGCTASASTSGTNHTIVLIALAGGGCALGNSTPATLTIAGIINPSASGSPYAANTFSVVTSKDTTAANPGSAVAISSANLPPNNPTSPAQFKLDGTTAISVGGATNETSVVLKGTVSDPNSDQTRLQVEVEPLGTAFANTPTATSAAVASGGTAAATVSGLSNGTSYHWQARAIDASNATSSWVSFGGNAEGVADFSVDTVAPSVTINQAGGQADPASVGPINFTVVFSESVSDFATGDVSLSGTAGATTATVTGSGTTYNVAVSGMTSAGTVIASIAAGKAHDAATNANTASTSSDNTVTYQPTSTITFSESGIPTADAGATGVLSVTVGVGSPTTYDASQFPVSVTVANGTSVSYTYNSPVGSINTGKRYVKTAGPAPASPITVSADANVSATYVTQWKVTFAQSGIGTDTGSNVVVSVSSVDHPKGDLPLDVWVTSGDTVGYGYAANVDTSPASGKRYHLSNGGSLPASPVTVTSAQTITGNYDTQWKVTFAQSGIGTDTGSNVVVSVSSVDHPKGDLPLDVWVTSGDTVGYGYAANVDTSPASGKRYHLSNGGSLPASPVTVTSAQTITGNYDTQWKVTFAQSGIGTDTGSNVVVSVSSVDHPKGDLPLDVWVTSGDTVGYGYAANVDTSPASGKRYHLSNGGSLPASPVTVTSAQTITGNYDTQWKVTFAQSGIGTDTGSNVVVSVSSVDHPKGDLPLDVWVTSGDTVGYGYAANVDTSPASGKRYHLSNGGSLPASPVTVTSAQTITGNYDTQWKVTFAQSGIGTDTGSNVVVSVSSVDHPKGDLPLDVWVTSGDTVGYGYAANVDTSPASGKRYHLSNGGSLPASPVTVTSAQTITGNYDTQWKVTFAQSGIGTDTGSNVVVSVSSVDHPKGDLPLDVWVTSGDTVGYGYAANVDTSPASGKRYHLSNGGSLPASPVTVTSAQTITGNYDTQWKVTFAQSGIGTDTGSNVVVSVSSVDHPKGDLPLDVWVTSGDTVGYGYAANVDTSPASGKRYHLSNGGSLPASPVTVTSAQTITGNYDTQWKVTFAQSGIGTDTGSNVVVSVSSVDHPKGDLPLDVWVTSGDTVGYGYAANVDTSPASGKRYHLSNGGSLPASPVTVTSAQTITGNYDTQWKVTFAQSGIGTDTGSNVVVSVSSVDHPKGDLPLDVWVTSGDTVGYGYAANVDTSPASGKRYHLSNGGSLPASPVTVTSAQTITGNYDTQWKVTFAQSGIGTDTGSNVVVSVSSVDHPKGDLPLDVWVTSGDTVGYGYAANVDTSPASGKRYHLSNGGSLPASPVTVTSAQTITGNYDTQWKVTFAQSGIGTDTGSNVVVSVSSVDHPKGDLPLDVWVTSGDTVGYGYAANVDTSPASGKRYHLSNGGSLPASPVTVTSAQTITGNYDTQWKVTFAQSGIGTDTGSNVVVSVSSVDHPKGDLPLDVWVTSGDTVGYGYAANVDTSPASGKRYHLSNGGSLPASPVTVTSAQTITGNYDTQWKVTFAQSGIGTDTGSNVVVSVSSVDHPKGDLPLDVWVTSGDTVGYGYAANVDTSPASGKRYHLSNGGSLPASPVTVTSAQTITGNYDTQWKVTFAQSGIGTDTGSNVVVSVSSVDHPKGDLPLDVWVTSGDTVGYGYAANVDTSPASGKRYHLSNGGSLPASPVTVTSAQTITGNYDTQWKVTFAQSGIGTDTGSNVVVSVSSVDHPKGDLPLDVWVTSGDTVGYGYAANVDTSPASGKRYHLSNGGSLPASPVTVTSAQTITGNYDTQWKVTFAQSGIGTDTGSNVVVSVSSVDHPKGDLPLDVWVTSGDTVGYGYAANVDTSPASGKRYHLSNGGSLPASPVTVTSAQTITGNYDTQWKVTFAQSGIGTDTGSNVVVSVSSVDHPKGDLPLDVWVTSGDTVGYGYAANVDTSPASGKRYHLSNGGSLPASPVTVTSAQTITGNYDTQWKVTFAQSGIGTDTGSNVVVSVSSVDHPKGDLPLDVWVTSGDTVGYGYAANVDTSPASGKRYHLSNGGSLPASPVTVTSAQTITGNYDTQWKVTFAQSGIGTDTGSNVVVTIAGTPTPAGSLPDFRWVTTGGSVTYAYSTPISTNPVSAVQYELGSVTGPASPITVGAAVTVTGNYTVNTYSLRYLQPIDQSSAASLMVNTIKNGRVVPTKVEIFKNGVELDTTNVPTTPTVKVVGYSCAPSLPTDPVEEFADPGASNANTNLFRWSTDSPGFWIYNLDTGGLGLTTNNCYRVDVYLGAGIKVSTSVYGVLKPTK